MKFALPILLSIVSLAAHAQLKGYSYGDQREAYSFPTNDEFYWKRESVSGTEVGDGTYHIKGDSIELTFDKIERTFELQLLKSVPNHTNQSHIEARAMLSNGKPFEGLRFILVASKIEAETDKKGIAHIDVPDALFKDQISVDLNGFISRIATVDLRGNDHAFGIVIDEAAPMYREHKAVTLAFKKKGRKIKLDGNQFKRTKIVKGS